MTRTFKHGPGPHSFPNHIQYAIQAHDMSHSECLLMRSKRFKTWEDNGSKQRSP